MRARCDVRGDPGAERPVLQAEHDHLAREVENLTAAIANGGGLSTLVAALTARDKRLAELRKELARPAALPDGVPDGIRTRVLALKGPRPRPLDDGDAR